MKKTLHLHLHNHLLICYMELSLYFNYYFLIRIIFQMNLLPHNTNLHRLYLTEFTLMLMKIHLLIDCYHRFHYYHHSNVYINAHNIIIFYIRHNKFHLQYTLHIIVIIKFSIFTIIIKVDSCSKICFIISSFINF